MPLDQLFYVGCIFALAGMLQSAVGFGYSLFATPLIVWGGVPLPETIAMACASSLVQNLWGYYRYHQHIDWAATLPIQIVRLLTIPLGVGLLGLLVDVGQSRVKQVVGLILLAVLLVHWKARVTPREKVHAGWTVLAGGASGTLTGLVGMGGPPIVLWIMAHDWPTQRSRSYIWALSIPMAPVTLAMLSWKFGAGIWTAAALGLACAPLVLIGSMAGLRLGELLSRPRLRLAATLLLLIVALTSIAAPMTS